MVRPQMVNPGQFKYAIREVRDDDGDSDLTMLTLDGACGKSDPLASVCNMDLLIKYGAIISVNIDGDCVITKEIL